MSTPSNPSGRAASPLGVAAAKLVISPPTLIRYDKLALCVESCTWCRSKDGGNAEKRAKAAVHCRQLPDYNEEEAPDGFFLKDGRIFWRSNWSNLRCALRGDVMSECKPELTASSSL